MRPFSIDVEQTKNRLESFRDLSSGWGGNRELPITEKSLEVATELLDVVGGCQVVTGPSRS